jgi:predicted metal-dependent HD superfamily phosphohydrolase
MDDTDLLIRSWHRAWSGLGASGNGDGARDELIARYNEPGRHYHTVRHLADCLAVFEPVYFLARHPAEVEMALWFHDAIYDVTRNDNEERSAELARLTLLSGGVDAAAANRVADLVRATGHTCTPADNDARLLVDIDLSILGAPRTRFIEYEAQVREEYAFVPEAVFWNKRRSILQGFLDRTFIYTTPHFRAIYEQGARSNIAWSISESGMERAPGTGTRHG